MYYRADLVMKLHREPEKKDSTVTS